MIAHGSLFGDKAAPEFNRRMGDREWRFCPIEETTEWYFDAIVIGKLGAFEITRGPATAV